MKRKSKRRSAQADALPPEIGTLLTEIEKEPVPERLLQLAHRLQEALADKRRHEEATTGTRGSAGRSNRPR